jgi:hypothetical protein
MKCPTCGEEVEGGSALCMNCGASLPFQPGVSTTPPPPEEYPSEAPRSRSELPGYVKVGIVIGAILVILVVIVIIANIGTLEIKKSLTYEEFQDKYGSGIPEDKIGENEYILDYVTQKYYNETQDTIGVNFRSSGRVTDTTSANQTYDLMIPGKFNKKFSEGNRIECHVELTRDGPEVFYVEKM